MGIEGFFNGVNNTMTNWGGTFYMGMFVLTILMMVLVFSWLNSKDADNSLIIGTAVLLFIPAFVFLTLWMSSVWAFSPLEKLKVAIANALFKGKVDIVAALLATVTPEVGLAAAKKVREEHGDEAGNRAELLVSSFNKNNEETDVTTETVVENAYY
tara:strand:- start:272 stop:739 length:468 start_codon:yes stop_codon:yes gene_type:complete